MCALLALTSARSTSKLMQDKTSRAVRAMLENNRAHGTQVMSRSHLKFKCVDDVIRITYYICTNMFWYIYLTQAYERAWSEQSCTFPDVAQTNLGSGSSDGLWWRHVYAVAADVRRSGATRRLLHRSHLAEWWDNVFVSFACARLQWRHVWQNTTSLLCRPSPVWRLLLGLLLSQR